MVPATLPAFDQDIRFCHRNAFGGFTFRYALPGGEAHPGTLVRVVFQVRVNLLDETLASVIQTISSDEASEIEITDAGPAVYAGIVKKQQLDKVPVGDWWWALEFEDSLETIDPIGKGHLYCEPRPVIPVP